MNDVHLGTCIHGKRPIRGFTLVELLVASTILLLLLAILLSVISNTTSIASTASQKIDTTRIARESFELIGRDLALASLPSSRSSTNSLQFLVNPPNISEFANRDTMFWQAPIARDSSKGSMSIIGYFVLRDVQANRENSRFQLRRVYIEPHSTNGDYNLYSTNTAWLSSQLIQPFAPTNAGLDNSGALKGWVADGVLGMWIQCLDKTGNVTGTVDANGAIIPGTFDSRNASFSSTNWTHSYPTNYPYSRLPASVEVTLVCVSPRDIVKIKSLPDARAYTGSNISNFVEQVHTDNPGAKTVTSYTRTFVLKNSD